MWARLERLAGRIERVEQAVKENDRRYAEVDREREKAVRITAAADLKALNLAREIQDYKDEKANELRTQIDRERGTYATQNDLSAAIEKLEATIKPLADYIAGAQGRTSGLSAGYGVLVGIAGLAIALAAFVLR